MCRRPMLESVLPQQTAPARATDASMPSAPTPATSSAPGIALASAGAGLALIVHAVVPAVSPLLVAILCGAVLSNAAGLRGGLPEALAPGLHVASRRFLRLGIVLLGLQLVIGDVLGLGWPVVAGAAVVVMGGLGATLCAGRLLGVPPSQSLLIACGFSICGAAAVAGADGVLRKRNGEETAAAVALVVIFGTAMIAALPAASALTGLSQHAAGVWVGASVHEVAQVVAAAGIIGAPALKVAVVVKLARVLMLAPVLILISMLERRTGGAAGRQPLVPLFVVGFLAAVVVRSLGILPAAVLDIAGLVESALLSAAMFALGCAVHWHVLRRIGGRALALAAFATLTVTVLGLAVALLA